MACSGRRRSGKRKLGHGATGRPGPALRHGSYGHWRRRHRWPAAASSEELAAGSESQLLMLQAPGEAAGSFLMAPGEVFASLAVAVVDAHHRATMRRRAQAWVRLRELVRKAAGRFLTAPCEVFASLAVAHRKATVRRHLRRAQAWVRLRELVRKAASRRFAWFGSALWLQAFDSRRRREAGDEPAMTVRLTHPEAMGREWGVDIAVYPSETAGSVKAYALGMLACGDLIPGACARRWPSARIRKVRARAAMRRACVRRACERAIRF